MYVNVYNLNEKCSHCQIWSGVPLTAGDLHDLFYQGTYIFTQVFK